jgi:acyl-coenzyme A thioesterase PaaI-like protein
MTDDPATARAPMTPWPDADTDPDAGQGSVWAPAERRGGDEYAALLQAQRLLNDRLAGAGLPPEVAIEVTARLDELIELAAGYQVDEHHRYDGWRPDLPGRGHPFLAPFLIDDESPGRLRGRVTFTRFHLGGNGAVHGGGHPLLFDDVLGRVANHRQDGIARTAYLHMDYRAVTPLDVELTYEASLDRVEGRKRFATGRLLGPDGTVLTEASGLFVTLLPGQP